MRFRYRFILWVLVILASRSLSAQWRYTIRARVVDAISGQAIPSAKVINKNRMISAVTDSSGVFTMQSGHSDTLYISTIGYYPNSIKIDDSLSLQIRLPEIALKPRTYELASIELNEMPSYQQFKHKILRDVLPDVKHSKPVAASLEAIENPYTQSDAIGVFAPVTALYMFFSKEGKAHKSLAHARERARVEREILPKYNRELVSTITGLTGEVLDEFFHFCHPSDEFLISANDYEVYHKVFKCLDAFIESKK